MLDLALQFRDGAVALGQLFFLAFQLFHLAVQRLFFLKNAAFLTLDLVATLAQLGFCFGTKLEHFILGFQHLFLFHGFGVPFRFFYNLERSYFCTADFSFRNRLADEVANT
ncbi:Uncharacterised protein [Mycobacterium tuberculosis]|nr:Uncharacterised protein [Mycobacterium tuberculosis]